MKKIFFGLLLCLIFSMNSFSGEYNYKKLKAKISNEILKRLVDIEIWTSYNSESDELNIWVHDSFLATVKYQLKLKQREQIREIMSKYEEWRNKAIEERVIIEAKKIGKPIRIPKTWFKLGDDWYKNLGDNYLTYYFVSVDADTHGMIISSYKLESSHNRFITYGPANLCLDYEDIQILNDVLAEENIEKFSEEAKRKEQIENEFK